MNNERQEERDPASFQKVFELASLLKKKQNITVRDDQYDFFTLLDAVRQFRDRRYRFRLIDTGRFDPFELEWITAHGADFYTTDQARPRFHNVEIINASAKKGDAIVATLINGTWDEGENGLAFSDLVNVGRYGVFLHLTNRQHPRDIQQVAHLAHNCVQGGSWLVYTHHGDLERSLVELGRNGAWIHMTDKSLDGAESQAMIRDVILSARSAGSNVVLHWDSGENYALLDEIVGAGAIVLFKSPLFDYRSPLKKLEKGIRKKRLDFRTYYLYPSVLP